MGNPDWLTDHLRFGGLLHYVDRVNTVGAGVALRYYPTYHRHISGRWVELENNARRISGILAITTPIVRDEERSEDVGFAFTAGIGIDIVHEVSILFGWSIYSFTPPEEDSDRVSSSFTVGFTLNAELFERLLGGAQ